MVETHLVDTANRQSDITSKTTSLPVKRPASPSPPVTPPNARTYQIIDIRSTSATGTDDAFGDSNLIESIVAGLDKPYNQKSIPTLVLYDNRGLQLFDQITYLPEYYLTNAEIDILKHKCDQVVAHIPDGSAVIELGAGALRKTSLVLQTLQETKRDITYYALDLDLQELERSLSSLGTFDNVKLVGLLGTYDDGIDWLSTKFDKQTPKTIMWLGSSVGNLNREEAAEFIGRIRKECMLPGDNFLIGMDQRNDPQTIALAYNEPAGITKEFIMNGLDHVNEMLGTPFIDRSNFAYISEYKEDEGRHVAHYQALSDCTLKYRPSNGAATEIFVAKDELIYVESSYKYSIDEMNTLLDAAELNLAGHWQDSSKRYSLAISNKTPFHFIRGQNLKKDMQRDFPGMPSEKAWDELWNSWELVTQTVLTKNMLFERPIALRHFFIFYIGHIPAFLDIQLSRALNEPFTEPAHFADIFERGIDPDMDDPSVCNPHSQVPTNQEDWPKVEQIIDFSNRVHSRLRNVIQDCATDKRHMTKRMARIIWMTFEHEAMHLETLLYMLVQSPNISPPRGFSTPDWVNKQKSMSPTYTPLQPANMIHIEAGTVSLGHDDLETEDNVQELSADTEFGWDNEHPKRKVSVDSFSIQSRPVTNGEYLKYLQDNDLLNRVPKSWIRETENTFTVKTVFGPCPLPLASDWPVCLSGDEASTYAQVKGMRLPTESELIRFREQFKNKYKSVKVPNVGFSNWHPTAVDNERVHMLGDVWEWTSTVWEEHDGFINSEVYPGYSADFFDGKHNVVLGGSWATHPLMAERKSFRNWYQRAYPYVFAGFRCAK